MESSKTNSLLVRLIDQAIRGAAFLATLSLIFIVVGICLDVLARYVFSSSIHGTQAIVEGLLLPAVLFLGAPLVGRMNGHMRIELLDMKRWPRLRLARRALFAILISAFWGLCAWQAGLRSYEAYALNQWPIGEIAAPAVVAFGLVAIGCFLAALAHLLPMPSAQLTQADVQNADHQ